MTPTVEAATATRGLPGSPVSDRIARYLLWLAALGATASAAGSVGTVWHADGATTVVETWRGYGFAVFAGLFVLLALRPHGYRGLWELVIANKVALTITALCYAIHGSIAGTGAIIIGDGGLSVLLIAAYLICRGWSSTPSTATTG
jgi:hypothetical protein